jgi:hypothetical protein
VSRARGHSHICVSEVGTRGLERGLPGKGIGENLVETGFSSTPGLFDGQDSQDASYTGHQAEIYFVLASSPHWGECLLAKSRACPLHHFTLSISPTVHRGKALYSAIGNISATNNVVIRVSALAAGHAPLSETAG